MSVKVRTFKGKGIETLTREELLEAIDWLFQELEMSRKWAEADLKMAVLFADTQIQLERARLRMR